MCDITYIRLADGSFVYLAIVLDVFTRVIRGWALGKDITHELALTALNKPSKKLSRTFITLIKECSQA